MWTGAVSIRQNPPHVRDGLLLLPSSDYFLGVCAGAGWPGCLGISTGMVVVGPFLFPVSVLRETEDWPPPGAGADVCGTTGGGVCPGLAGAEAGGCLALSNTVLPPTEPALRVARMD